MVFLVADFENVYHSCIYGWYHLIASRHDVTSIPSITLLHLSCSLTILWFLFKCNGCWVVGIEKYTDTMLASCCKHVTTSRHDVTMWRHAIVWNWSNTSMLSVFTCQLTRYTKILLNCSMSTSSGKWNEICDIVTGRHDYDVTAWSEVIMQMLMLWHFLIKNPKQPYI